MKFVLAPLAGFTDAPFRRLSYEGGADLTYTEMVSAAALAHDNIPMRQLMEVMEGEGPVVCQLFGATELDLSKATRVVPNNFVEINLNAGCPMTKVTRTGAGAKLVESPEKVYKLLKAMKENTALPISLKTRLGPHPQKTNVFELLDAAEKAGAKSIILHARYTSQMHGGEVNYDLLKAVVEAAKIPVIGNGSVVDSATVKKMAATGVNGIMIGRAALARPAIFSELKGERVNFDKFEALKRHLEYILKFRNYLAKHYPHVPSEDGYASVKLHTHLFRYFNGEVGAAKLRAKLNSVRTLCEIYDIISQYGNGRY